MRQKIVLYSLAFSMSIFTLAQNSVVAKTWVEYANEGRIQGKVQKNTEAIELFTKAISSIKTEFSKLQRKGKVPVLFMFQNNLSTLYADRATALANDGQFERALDDLLEGKKYWAYDLHNNRMGANICVKLRKWKEAALFYRMVVVQCSETDKGKFLYQEALCYLKAENQLESDRAFVEAGRADKNLKSNTFVLAAEKRLKAASDLKRELAEKKLHEELQTRHKEIQEKQKEEILRNEQRAAELAAFQVRLANRLKRK